MSGWYFYVPGVVIVLAGVAAFKWLAKLQERMNDHAERIARMEGRGEARRSGP